MKLSYNWLKRYIKLDKSIEELEQILTAIGLEVEGIEHIKNGPDLEGVVVGEVVHCQKHPDADRLKLTKVDVGKGELLQIVCGAPNVQEGQKVMVATIGTILPSEDEKVFKIKKGKIRGQLSEGMICAEDELGLSDDHEGILVLGKDAKIGMPAEKYFNFSRDVVFEIGLTPNRSDATNVIGVAKDLQAYINFHEDVALQIEKPDVSEFVEGDGQVYQIEIKDAKACPRYAGLLLENISVGPSPDFIKEALQSIGIRSINNIVDITNFVLHECGQALHAFDADMISGDKIIVQKLPEGISFLCLDEVERKLDKEDLMICNGNGEGMCIAGVFGGLNSGVTESTKSIFLESAHFEASSIRRTSFRHLLRTDAAMLFEKGSDPNICVYALKRAALLMKEYAGASVTSKLIDIYPEKIERKKVQVSLQKVNSIIGVQFTKETLQRLFDALDFEIVKDKDDIYDILIPTNKADVTRPIDVVEELLRIYGYDNVKEPGYLKTAIQYSNKIDSHRVKNKISNILQGAGFVEMMGLSLVEDKYNMEEWANVVKINNTSNVHLNIMRPQMVYTGMEAINYNFNRQNRIIRLFENGRSYRREKDTIVEKDHLAIYLSGNRIEENWLQKEKRNLSFFDLKTVVHLLLEKFGLLKCKIQNIESPYFDYGLSYNIGNKEIVNFGKVSQKLQQIYQVKKEVFVAIFDWENVLFFISKNRVSHREQSKFPTVKRDLALVINNSVKMEQIEKIAFKTEKKLLKNIQLFDVYVNEEQLGKDMKSYAISFTFEDIEKTLKDKEVNKIMNTLIHNYEKELDAYIRK